MRVLLLAHDLPTSSAINIFNKLISMDLLQVSVVTFPNATDSGQAIQNEFQSKVQYNMQLEINNLIVESWEDYVNF